MKKVFLLLGAVCLAVLLVCAVNAHRRQMERCQRLESEIAGLAEELSRQEVAKAELQEELSGAQSKLTYSNCRDNPIDEYFYAPTRRNLNSGTTIEEKVEAHVYCEAWRLEFLHALGWVQGRTGDKFPEDRQLLERYQALIEEQAELSWDLSKLRGAGMDASPEERETEQQYLFGTLYGAVATMDRAEAYRQGFFWLLDTYSYLEPWDEYYEFYFDDTVRADIAGEYEALLFPPIADIVKE